MADRALTASLPRALAGAPVRIAIVYLAARLVTTAFLLLASALSGFDSRYGPSPGLGSFVLGWDAQWYWLIAEQGYPSELPRTEEGVVAENAWAFMPLYPVLARGVGVIVGSWGAGAFLVSLVAGYLCCLVLYRMVREGARREGARPLDESTAMWAVVLFSCAPLAALFQVGYAESLFLLWILLGLRCLQERRYAWLYLLIPLMAYTRPGVLAFALLIGLHGIVRLVRRAREPLAGREIVHILALGALAVVTGFSWAALTGWVTGEPDAYFATELAWRRDWIGDDHGFVPFSGWFGGAQFWLERVWGLPAGTGLVVAVLLLALLAAVLLWDPRIRRLGVDVRLWCAAYLLYLFAVFFPQSSLFRLLFPLSPLWGAVAQPRSRAWRIGVLVLCLLGQWWWIWNMYGSAVHYWQIP